VIVAAIVSDSGTDRPIAIVARALTRAGRFFDENREIVIGRHEIIRAHPEFQERELLKMRDLARAIETALIIRGNDAAMARMASDLSITLWSVAIERWVGDGRKQDFATHLAIAMEQMLDAAAGGTTAQG
jgi:hypothetical protein